VRATWNYGMADSHFYGYARTIGNPGKPALASGGPLNAVVTAGPEFSVPALGYGWSTGTEDGDPTPAPAGSITGGSSVNGYTLSSFWWFET
jgi:hypothetical protein